jgi:pimeloyl-ACP methyl ester carboxylesterase
MKRVTTSGGEMAFSDDGLGPAVLLLHGFPWTSHVWRALIPALTARHRVIALDLLGLGGSAKPADVPLGLDAQAAYAGELLDALDVDRVAVIGHGTGGGVAQLLAVDRHEVEALVLIDTTVTGTAGIAWEPGGDPASGADPAAAIRARVRTDMLDRDLPEADVQAYLAPWADPAAVPAFARWANAVDTVALARAEAAMPTWHLPVMILWGEDDGLIPPEAGERLNEAIRSSAFGLVPGCGHLLPEDAPETIFPIIAEYLRANYLRLPHGHDIAGPVLVPLGGLGASEIDDDEDDEPIVRTDQEVGPNP